MPLLIAAFVLYLAVFIAALSYAFWKGGKDERSGAATILIGALLSQVASVMGPLWEGPELGVMAIDIVVFVVFVAIAYGSRKFWPIWAAASQLVAVLTHLAVVLNPTIGKVVYATTQPVWVFPMLAALAVGTHHHQRRLRRLPNR